MGTCPVCSSICSARFRIMSGLNSGTGVGWMFQSLSSLEGNLMSIIRASYVLTFVRVNRIYAFDRFGWMFFLTSGSYCPRYCLSARINRRSSNSLSVSALCHSCSSTVPISDSYGARDVLTAGVSSVSFISSKVSSNSLFSVSGCCIFYPC